MTPVQEIHKALVACIGQQVKHNKSNKTATLHKVPRLSNHATITNMIVIVKYRRPNGLIQYREWKITNVQF